MAMHTASGSQWKEKSKKTRLLSPYGRKESAGILSTRQHLKFCDETNIKHQDPSIRQILWL